MLTVVATLLNSESLASTAVTSASVHCSHESLLSVLTASLHHTAAGAEVTEPVSNGCSIR